jgi:hypothetical protein
MAGKYKTKQQSAILDCLKLQEKEYVTVTDIEKYLKDKGCADDHLPTLGQNGKGWHCCKD